MIFLWTDTLIYLLLAALIGMAFTFKSKDHVRRPLKKIGENRVGMVSLAILLFYLSIGLVDSIHFKSQRDNNEIISLLDYVATPLRAHSEKTYSAPFATTLYGKEMVTVNGGVQWDYPRLAYGGRHLTDPESGKTGDILQKCLTGILIGIGIFAVGGLIVVSVYFVCYGKILKLRETLPVVVVFFCLTVCASLLSYLSLYYHVFGTDKVGEDVFYQTIKSVRTGLVIGTLTTLVMLPFAILFGILAGFFRGWVDDVIQYLYTTLNSIPGVLLIAASVLMVQVYMANHEDQFTSVVVRADMRLLFLCMILGVTSWTGLCRLLRAETLKLREMEYVQAAYALGVRQSSILRQHILPNVMHIVLISVVLDFSSLVLAEAVLSYINIGVDPTTYSWGNMINGARLEMAREPIVWWSLTAAFVFMFALVLAANLFADVVQEAFDPRSAVNENAG